MLGRVKLDNTLLTCDQGNFNQITARGRNRTLVTVVRDTSTTTVPPAPLIYQRLNCLNIRIRIGSSNFSVSDHKLLETTLEALLAHQSITYLDNTKEVDSL